MRAKQLKAERDGHFYPYLSVDPKNNPPAHADIPNCESLDYLNIKFDTKSELRESYFKNFRKRLTSKMFEVISDQQAGQDQRRAAKKTLLNPEQLIRSPAFKSIKETSLMPQRQSSHHPRRSITQEDTLKTGQGSAIPKQKCFTFDKLSINQQEKSLKRKKNIYQKMLKRVDQLREIYKYETELMNITELREEPPLRFHTEPIHLDFTPKDPQGKFIKKKEHPLPCPRKISPQHRNGLIRTQGHQASGERTLEVRRYRNDTSMKKRMKYLLRRQLMRQEYTLSDQKTPSQQRTQLKDSKRTRKGNDRQAVGPWDAEQSTFFLREEEE